MVTISKIFGIAVLGIIIAIGSMVTVASTTLAGAPVQSRTMPPAITAMPNIGGPGAEIMCYGANFEPGETVKVVYLFIPGVENVLGSKAKGLALKVNELGSFSLKSNLPKPPGVYPIRVYDKDDNMIASTVVVVEKKEKKK